MAQRRIEARRPRIGKSKPMDEIRRLQANLNDENDGAALYRMIAAAEPLSERRHIFERPAMVESRHAEIRRRRRLAAGVEPRDRGPSFRARLAGFVAHHFGVRAALPFIRSLESGAYATYMAQDATARRLAPDEKEHELTLARLEHAP